MTIVQFLDEECAFLEQTVTLNSTLIDACNSIIGFIRFYDKENENTPSQIVAYRNALSNLFSTLHYNNDALKKYINTKITEGIGNEC